MGVSQSRGSGPITADLLRKAFDPVTCREVYNSRDVSPEALCNYSIFDDDREKSQELVSNLRANVKKLKPEQWIMNRSFGSFIGMVIGDAAGAPLEFSSVRYGVDESKGLDDTDIWFKREYNSFRLQPGQWTDDASMGLCIADSLLVNKDGFDPLDLRMRFLMWHAMGYCNAFGLDTGRWDKTSVGLGGNIGDSLRDFLENGGKYTTSGDLETSGNGSVMRNGAIPSFFRNDIQAGMDAAYKQSKTTHMGEEAAELCRLITFLCIKFINGAKKDILDDIPSAGFSTELYSVECLANGEREKAHPTNKHLELRDRMWEWKSDKHIYCVSRSKKQPGYIGSYAMDNVSMSLHCLYTTSSFTEAVMKAANMRGDADSVAAVVGQLAGALYGVTAIPESWVDKIQQWDSLNVVHRAFHLYNHSHITSQFSDQAIESAVRGPVTYVKPTHEGDDNTSYSEVYGCEEDLSGFEKCHSMDTDQLDGIAIKPVSAVDTNVRKA
eukprot:TRINITY_DN650_c2_g6_i1.p1 TRINITY_DN650_c2_g6~~TRINITY_DN650_c2_g6_i1.p1  ORF type:complete len:495 (+),score=84.75 TRINITY_DN650_c2_g6_i1:73-1557(+)